ncbi:MAG: hypothetical protein BRD52_06880 [Bacteroidetes bacterium SW_4_67_19]|nr:MAG: hypothetical protein BRD52_06880 [Bacteroidetes bacterium SW_4_67_19]
MIVKPHRLAPITQATSLLERINSCFSATVTAPITAKANEVESSATQLPMKRRRRRTSPVLTGASVCVGAGWDMALG